MGEGGPGPGSSSQQGRSDAAGYFCHCILPRQLTLGTLDSRQGGVRERAEGRLPAEAAGATELPFTEPLPCALRAEGASLTRTRSCEPGPVQSLLHSLHLGVLLCCSSLHPGPPISVAPSSARAVHFGNHIRLNNLHPPPGAEMVGLVFLQGPPGLSLSILECVCVCMDLCVYGCMCVCVCVSKDVYVWMCVHECVWMCVYVNVCVYVCVWMYVCVCVCVSKDVYVWMCVDVCA